MEVNMKKLKKVSIYIGGALFLLTNALVLGACSSFGKNPEASKQNNILQSENYDKNREMFVNRKQERLDKMNEEFFKWKTIKKLFKSTKDREPNDLLPQEKPDIAKFLDPSDELKIIWFGHSSFLLNMDGKIVLVDPVFQYASPFSFFGKRYQNAILKREELPEIDYILISHDHYDHLEMNTMKYYANKDIKFIVPLGIGSHLTSWGVKKENIFEKDWWQEQEFDGIKFVATPSQHFSGRTLTRNKTLWASWVIQSKNHNIYFSGDTGYDVHFKQIGEKYGPFDLAFIENGQYNESWEAVHLLPHQSIQAFKDLNAKKLFPIHWGMFTLSIHSWYEPIQSIDNLAAENDVELVAPKIGQIIELGPEYKLEKW